MVHLRQKPKRTGAGLGLFLSLLLIAGAGVAIAVAGSDGGSEPAAESPATARPTEPDGEPEPAIDATRPKDRNSKGTRTDRRRL